MGIIDAFFLGIIEGLTEFLPISSTGHLIIASHLMGIEQSDFHKSFEVIIQLGAILAVVVSFFKSLWDFKMLFKLAIAFIPTGVLGLLLYSHIKALFSADVVAYMLIIGGVIFILVDYFGKDDDSHKVKDMASISIKQAFLIGCFQSLAMIPGTSRSGATIIGGWLVGLDKFTATKFSFFLAVPTMLVATVYDIYKNYESFAIGDGWLLVVVGFCSAFVTALVAIRLFLHLIGKIGFIPFGIYRIIVGVLFLSIF